MLQPNLMAIHPICTGYFRVHPLGSAGDTDDVMSIGALLVSLG